MTSSETNSHKVDPAAGPDGSAPASAEQGAVRPEDEAPAQPGAPATESALAKRAAELEEEQKRTHDRLLRTAADFENFKRRSRTELTDSVRRAEDKVVCDFLPVLDNIERALAHVEVEATDPAVKSLVDGMRMVHKQFVGLLGRYGIQAVEALATPFDPEKHEAIQQQASDEPKGTVLRELQRGYSREGKLVRPAMVVVSQGPVSPPPTEAGADPGPSDDAKGEATDP
ncbi:MAG: nucleotide exchange factor GrpE [Deltaproteobacteria bacterium]|nr:nucleotide exchange factor GrpE [Deltaproteobacteria bacterium]